MTQKYKPTWKSLKDYSVPQWYQDAKFGIFIHWGIYCVPAFANEWYPRNMYVKGSPEFQHHCEVWGPHSMFGYKDFVPMFKAERFEPSHWADLFKRAGARYVVPVAEHHDGFAMYDCSFSRWTAAKMGPKRDIVGELAAEVRKEGMALGVSSHRAEHWWFFNGGRAFDSDVQDSQFYDLYGPAKPGPSHHDQEAWRSKDWQPKPDGEFLEDWLARTCELVDKYQPELVWFDWWIEQMAFESYLQRFAAYYYNRGIEWGQGVVINYKNEAFPAGTAVFDIERGQLKGIHSLFWQTDTAVSKNSWGYTENQDYKTPASIIHDLIDIVSKNGSLLLNIGPRPDGIIPEPEEEILLEIGRWLAINGEAIYGTRPWKVYGEGPTEVFEGAFQDTKRAGFTPQDMRFTTKGDVLYVIVLGWSESGEVVIESLGAGKALYPNAIKRIELLGSTEAIQWSRDADGLEVKLPSKKPTGAAFVLKVTRG